MGTHYLTGFADGELTTVTQEIKHPNGIDVRIIVLDHNITNIQPVRVLFSVVRADVLTLVRGWGYVRRGGPQSRVLKVLSVTTWSYARASAALFPRRVNDTMLGAGGEKGEDSCGGDLGGPLTIEINGVVRLVGVASWGAECGLLDKPGVYARVSTARAFIAPYRTCRS
ncbi:hypothetical protein DYB25_008278 [Aphanomyces astaci]|uniref:Peptidase S1 domain-containing protein n=1 Tax=Aphanomyces astaci TaxID=112090 RepID=A0A397AS88_APHAT|nr:hypothetical protein DYB25_008278 [Aphanomyces astaci]